MDEKLGNIFLLDVVYSWIPSTCEKFESLGHKAKMCLHKEDKIPLTNEKNIEHKDMDIPVVVMDSLLDNNASSL